MPHQRNDFTACKNVNAVATRAYARHFRAVKDHGASLGRRLLERNSRDNETKRVPP
jgi:hypothetical protein